MRKTLTMIAATTLLGLASCGSDKIVAMPNVETQRLDVALSDIGRAGYDSDDVEIIGGGTFGVVDESNWSVCDQDPAAGDEIGDAPRLVVERNCDNEDRPDPESEGNSAEEPDDKADATAEEETSPSENESAAAAARAKKDKKDREKPAPVDEMFAMPHLIGMNLQDAQDTLQTFGSYLLTQTDATGMQRFQVLDSNWKVCYQDPRPGTATSVATIVDLGAVKLDERC